MVLGRGPAPHARGNRPHLTGAPRHDAARRSAAVSRHRLEGLIDPERFFEEACDAELRDLPLHACRGGDDHDRDVSELWIRPLNAPELEAVHDRHEEVEQDHGGKLAAGAGPGPDAVPCGHDVVALLLQEFLQRLTDVAIVVDQQDMSSCCPGPRSTRSWGRGEMRRHFGECSSKTGSRERGSPPPLWGGTPATP